jgi:Mn-dependent transcriptional regulator
MISISQKKEYCRIKGCDNVEGGLEFHTVRGYQLLNQSNNPLTPAMEDYLEMIYRNIEKNGYMRVNTLSDLLNVKPSSATKMVQNLAQLGFINYKKYGIIFLTEQGAFIGKFLLERHNTIERFLTLIGINEDALIETELIEHNISVNTTNTLKILNEFLIQNPDLLTKFEDFKAKLKY